MRRALAWIKDFFWDSPPMPPGIARQHLAMMLVLKIAEEEMGRDIEGSDDRP